MICQERNILFLSHSDIIDPSQYVNKSKLHFNRQGIRVFAENISGFLAKLNSHQHRNSNILTKVSRKEFQTNVSNFNNSVSPSRDILSYKCDLPSGTVKKVRYNCSADSSVHLFIIARSSHSHIKWNQPQSIFLQYSCSVTMINIIKKHL